VVRAKVLSMDDEKKEMVLSIRLATPNPWQLFAEKHNVGDVVNGAYCGISEEGFYCWLIALPDWCLPRKYRGNVGQRWKTCIK